MISSIPLKNRPNQTFPVTIPGDTRNLPLILTISYNGVARYWVLGIYSVSRAPIVVGIPLFPGVDLLGTHQHLNIGNAALINVGNRAASIEYPDDPTLDQYELWWRLV